MNSNRKCCVRDRLHEHDRRSAHYDPTRTRAWVLAGTVGGGVLALIWLVLRTGTRPSRFAYPCQQAAFGTTAAVFGVPVATATVGARFKLSTALRTPAGKIAVVVLIPLVLAVFRIASAGPADNVAIMAPTPDHHPLVFLVNGARGILPGRYGGVDDLITVMGLRGSKWHRSGNWGLTAGPDGLIGAADIVLIKINAQWPERGGTNTDVLRGVIRRIVEHPDGFVGEIVVADNGQGLGSLNRAQNNAEDRGQSTAGVVADFASEGWNVSSLLWDGVGYTSVGEYDSGDTNDGYVVSAAADPETLIKVSYPKFTTASGTHISYKHGIWSDATGSYDSDRLVVINMPVFKTHSIYAITASVKNHMGVVTRNLGTDSHNAVGRGGLGTFLADVRVPDLTILDCVWVLARPGSGPSASYGSASRRDQLAACTDPVALDAWATKFIMIPQIIANGYAYDAYHNTQDPDNPNGVFRRYLDRSMNELLAAGIATTNDYDAVRLHVWGGDLDRNGRVDMNDFASFATCFGGPVVSPPIGCSATEAEASDLDGNGIINLGDFASFAVNFTG